MTKSAEEKAAEDWITRNMSWDHYEGDWVNAGIETYLAGRESARKEMQ